MRVQELEVELALPPPLTPRTVGIHLSSIIRCLAIEAGILKSDTAEELSLVDVRTITDPVAVLRICIGLAWEEWYIPQLQEVVDHPGEVECDGIYMTPDGESISSVFITSENCGEHVLIVHEVKSTYKSIRTVGDVSGQWLWLAQIKAYCRAKGTRFAMLHCLFLCGDYSYPIKPVIKRWMLEFTQAELDDNWNLITEYRDERMKQVDGTAS